MHKHLTSKPVPKNHVFGALSEFERNLIKERTLAGLEEAVALCGVAKDTLMKIEHGRTTCQLGSVLQICTGLGINLYAAPWDKIGEDEDE